MPSKYPVCKPKEVVRILERKGFRKVSQRGSHSKYSDGKHTVIIPMHDELLKGTLKSVLYQAGLSLDEFMKLRK